MSSARSVVDQDHRMVMYRPEWRTIAGSLTAAILLSRIHYWWNKSGNKRFYKFVQIPESPNAIGYKDGDSWLEETGMSLNEYHGAMKKIGRRLKKDEIDDHETALGDGYLVGYYITQKHQTYFYLNDRLLNEKLEQLYGQTDEDSEDDCYPNPHLNFPNGKIPNGKIKDRHIGNSEVAESEIKTRYITKQQQSNNKANPTTTTRTHADDHDDGSDLDFSPIDEGFASISQAYQNEIGALSPMISDGIKAELDDIRQILAKQPQGGETAEQWILYAIEQAVSSNARRWDYTRGVIKGVKRSKSLAAHKLNGSRKEQKRYASNSRRNKQDEAERNREINSKRGYYNPYTNETFDAQGNIVPQVQ